MHETAAEQQPRLLKCFLLVGNWRALAAGRPGRVLAFFLNKLIFNIARIETKDLRTLADINVFKHLSRLILRGHSLISRHHGARTQCRNLYVRVS